MSRASNTLITLSSFLHNVQVVSLKLKSHTCTCTNTGEKSGQKTNRGSPAAHSSIKRFSEAGLLEWMHFVIFRARSHSALPGRFLSRRCFTLCITVEVEPRIAKQYKCQYCCSCKNYCGKGMEGGKKVSLRRFFWLTRRLRVRRKNTFWGIL